MTLPCWQGAAHPFRALVESRDQSNQERWYPCPICAVGVRPRPRLSVLFSQTLDGSPRQETSINRDPLSSPPAWNTQKAVSGEPQLPRFAWEALDENICHFLVAILCWVDHLRGRQSIYLGKQQSTVEKKRWRMIELPVFDTSLRVTE